jgi:hypothetical protein
LPAFEAQDVDGPAYTYNEYWIALPDHDARMITLPPIGMFAGAMEIDRP